MKKYTKICFSAMLACFCILFFSSAQAKIDDLFLDFDKIKAKIPIKKRQPKPKIKMVETVEEWQKEAQNIPLEERKLESGSDIKLDKNAPKLKYVFEKYNYPQGKRDLNIEDIKNRLGYYPFIVADKNFQYIAYPYYYYSPDLNQISSNFYVEKLDTTKIKTKRILDYNHVQKERNPIIEAGTKEIYPNLFQGLTLVDWSADSKKLLIKEKIGSTLGGIYRTYLYVHFLAHGIEEAKTIKITALNEAVKEYYTKWENKHIVKYKYDIEPLGFSSENDNIIIALAYVYDKENNRIFLGSWGYNCVNGQVILLSKTDYKPSVSVNGLFLKQVLD